VKARFDVSSSHPLELFTRLHEQASFWDLDGYLHSSVPRPDMHWGVSLHPVAGLTTGISGLSVNGQKVEIGVEAGKDTTRLFSNCYFSVPTHASNFPNRSRSVAVGANKWDLAQSALRPSKLSDSPVFARIDKSVLFQP
jgi:hypothetical protein